ncbi:MAG: hypothetical protein ACE5FQ_16310 [Thiogranum sp.]
MKKYTRLLGWFFILLCVSMVVASCTGKPVQQLPDDQTSRDDMAGKTASIYFYREKFTFLKAGIQETWVYVDGIKNAILDNYQYAVVPVTPGAHDIMLRADSNVRKFTLQVELGDGETRYYKVINNPAQAYTINVIPLLDTLTTIAAKLEPADQDEFNALKTKLQVVPLLNEKNSPAPE